MDRTDFADDGHFGADRDPGYRCFLCPIDVAMRNVVEEVGNVADPSGSKLLRGLGTDQLHLVGPDLCEACQRCHRQGR